MLILDRQTVTKLRSRKHHAAGQVVEHSLLKTARLSVVVLHDDLEVELSGLVVTSAKWMGVVVAAARCSVDSTRCSLACRR